MSVPWDTPGPAGRTDAVSTQELGAWDTLHATRDPGMQIVVVDLDWLAENMKDTAERLMDAGSVGDAAYNIRKLQQEFGQSGGWYRTTRYRTAAGSREYIVLRGYPGRRSTLTAPRYAADNPKVVNMMVGKVARAKAALRSVKVAIVVLAAIDVIEHLISDEALWTDLGVTLMVDVASAVTSTVIGQIVAGVAAAGTGSIVVPIAVGVAVAIGVGLLLDHADDELQLTQGLQRWARSEVEEFNQSVHEARRTWNALSSPEGMLWLMRRLNSMPP